MKNIAIKFLVLLVLVNLNYGSTLCPAACFCEDERLLVRCYNENSLSTLDILPITLNPSTERLIIKFNSIKIIDSSIQFYSELRLLDLSNNCIHKTEDKIFIYQNKLVQLHLNNNKISQINNNTFKGLVRVETLNLRENYIMEIKNHVFASIPNIEYLNLGKNRIGKIESEAFCGLKNLKSLYLDDNILTSIPDYAFQHIPYLAELFIGLNTLTTLESDSFKSLINLVVLDLHGSSLENISSTSFGYHLRNLKSLDLSDNAMLIKIPSAALHSLHRLEYLKIGQNNVEIIEEGSFFGLSFLRKVEISGCKRLKQIQAGAFAANPNLESITISGNKLLEDIHDGVFSSLPHLKHVDLSNNAFKIIREQWLQWSSLKSFEVSGNPVNCNCNLIWLQHLLATSTKNAHDIICATPLKFYDQRLQDITEELTGCATDSSSGIYFGFFLIVASLTLIVLYKERNYLRMKFKRKAQYINNESDCSFDHCHIYEEIRSKHLENMNNIINCNNIYSFGFPNHYSSTVTHPI